MLVALAYKQQLPGRLSSFVFELQPREEMWLGLSDVW